MISRAVRSSGINRITGVINVDRTLIARMDNATCTNISSMKTFTKMKRKSYKILSTLLMKMEREIMIDIVANNLMEENDKIPLLINQFLLIFQCNPKRKDDLL